MSPASFRRRCPRACGFTLLELLVAMAILGIVGALALGGLSVVATQQSIASRQMGELAQLQRTMRQLASDLGQAQPRFVRDELGLSTELPFVADGRSEFLLRLTRGGWRNPAGLPRGTLQRVQYRFEDGTLYRDYWPVLDRTLGMEPRSEELLADLDAVEFDFLDDENEWHEEWPPLQLIGDVAAPPPRAARVRIESAAWGELERLVEVPR